MAEKSKDSKPKCVFLFGEKCILGEDSLAHTGDSKEIKPQTKASKYNLGKDVSTLSPEKAKELLVQRDFEDVWNNKQTSVHFIPPCFISKCPKALRYEKDQWPQKCLEEDQEYLKWDSVCSVASGDQSERWLYEMLDDHFRQSEDKEVSIFFQVPFHNGESDCIIISRKLRLILVIEVKRSFNKSKAVEARRQCERTLNNLQNLLKNKFSPEWICIKMAAFDQIQEKDKSLICNDCHKYVLTKNTHFYEFWSTLDGRKCQLESDNIKYTSVFANLLKVCKTHMTSYTKTTNEVHKMLTETTSTPQNIMFWSNDQYNILKDSTKTHVIFPTVYGSGKTELLIAKANEAAKEIEKNRIDPITNLPNLDYLYSNVYFIICDDKLLQGNKELHLVNSIKRRLRNDIEVRHMDRTGFSFSTSSFFSFSPGAKISLFIDECRPEDLLQLANPALASNLWVALVYKEVANDERFKNDELVLNGVPFHLAKLGGNLRNSKSITKAVFGHEYLAGENLPALLKPKIFLLKEEGMDDFVRGFKQSVEWMRQLTDETIFVLVAELNGAIFRRDSSPKVEFQEKVLSLKDWEETFKFSLQGTEAVETESGASVNVIEAESFNGETAKSVVVVHLPIPKLENLDIVYDLYQYYSRATTNLAIVCLQKSFEEEKTYDPIRKNREDFIVEII